MVVDDEGNEVTLKVLDRVERPEPKARSLKETDYAASPTECKTSVERLKNDMIDYNYAIAQAKQNGKKFTDDTFPWPYAIHWPNFDNWYADASFDVEHLIHSWSRISQNFSSSDYSLWGTEGILPEDSIQGSFIGNCWLIAAAIGVAEEP